jgi:membrane peptidoglycan carboxypeptidase
MRVPWRRRLPLLGASLAVLVLAAGCLAGELRSSRLHSRYLAYVGRASEFHLERGSSPAIRFPEPGPYDERLGYSRIPEFVEHLQVQGYRVAAQARLSPQMVRLSDRGLFLPYREKSQAGLTLLDCRGDPRYASRFPQRVFEEFSSVPGLLVASLLFVENRELLDDSHPTRNPAIEWGRFTKAVIDQLWSVVNSSHPTPGASTLATQIEKYRHSLGGRTASASEKLRQMASASLRAYLDGVDTRPARRQIVLNYLNSMPLAARPGHGEVHGLGDGLAAWYGRDFAEVGRLLDAAAEQDDAAGAQLRAPAQAYKQALSLFIAQRRPSYYLRVGEAELEQQTNSYLRLLAQAGIISPALRDAALPLRLRFKREPASAPAFSFVSLKSQTALRAQLSGMLGVPRLYDLDRLDLTATSSLNPVLQDAFAGLLEQIRDPKVAHAKGLYGLNLLSERNDPAELVISFSLFERGVDANRLRVQIDNFDKPFDLNQGARLDLGSTAKLRTLAHHLELVAELHREYADLGHAELAALPIDARDGLRGWARDYLLGTADRSLDAMLEAAMDREYSAKPWERFFTGGGSHTFANFHEKDNVRVMSLREAFSRSVNLVFIRLMREIEHYYVYRPGGIAARILADPAEPLRAEYLARFADWEGRVFLARFYRKYEGKSPEQAEALLLESVPADGPPLAAVARSLVPAARPAQFNALMRRRLPGVRWTEERLRELFEVYDPVRMSLADRGYIADVHPLELWLVGYLRRHPQATLRQAVSASEDERQLVYEWLFQRASKEAQDQRIRTMLGLEAFDEIGERWRRLGYPFEALTPSYATAIGASGDRPAALSELMGIIVNDGMRLPTVRIEALQFAGGTPFETQLVAEPRQAERLLAPQVTRVLREALVGVVEDGTARRLKTGFLRADGSHVALGGKTGTGDHRYEVYAPGGRLISSRVVNRSATLAFMIDDRFFGTLTVYVPEPYAARYKFTSTLPVQLLGSLAGDLMPLLESTASGDAAIGCPAPAMDVDQSL